MTKKDINSNKKKIKIQGEVFTPKWMVEKILDMSDYSGEKILKKYVMENSFGQGAFLDIIIDRYIAEAKKKNFTEAEIHEDLSVYIYGIELEPANFNIVKSKYSYLKNLYNSDTLLTNFDIKFDYILGNFPYVRVHNLKKEYKEKIEPIYKTLFGTYDLYYAFYEWSIKHLAESGTIGVITPTGFTTNTSGIKLRQLIDQRNIWNSFEDVSEQNIFEDVSTYTGVFVLKSPGIESPWSGKKVQTYNLSSFTKVQSGLATNADPIFIKPKGFFSKEIRDEGLVKPAYKCSSQTINEIIWPYSSGKLIDEATMLSTYPNTFKYLTDNKNELLDRSLKGVKWYAYARSQGIKDMLKKKIAVSLLNPEGKLIYKELPANTVVYQGVFFTGNLKKVKSFLIDKNFIKSVQALGIKRQSNYNQLTAGVFKKI
jgi:adenine-specific DNA-methyltransferase